MAFLGDLLIRLRAETADFQGDLGKAAYAADKAMRDISHSVESAKRALEVLGVAVTAGEFARGIKEIINSADELGKMGQRLGASTEWLSGMQYQAKLANVESEALSGGLAKLAANAAAAAGGNKLAANTFKALGVSVLDANGHLKTTEQLYDDVSKRFASFADSAAKTALARDAFGKGGERLIVLLNGAGDAAAKAEAELDRFGARVSSDMAAQASEFNDQLSRLATLAKSSAMAITNELLPKLNDLVSKLVEGRASLGSFGTLLANMMTTSGNDAANPGAKLKELRTSLDSMMQMREELTQPSFANSLNDIMFGDVGDLDKQISATKAKIEYLKVLERLQAPQASYSNEGRGSLSGSAKTAAPIVSKPDPAALAEVRKYESALQSLEQKLGKLNGQSELEIIKYQTLKGTLKDLTPEHKRELEQLAIEVDKRTELIKRMDLSEKALTAESAALEAQERIRAQAFEQYKDFINQQQFEISLIGRSAIEQRRLNALHQVDLELRQQLRAVAAAAGDDPEALAKGIKDAEELANRKRDAVNASVDARLQAERRWSTGAASAFNDYIDHATNAAEQSQMLFANAFQSMEDALVNFVKTGKLDFKSLADSIVSDLIRIQIRQGIAAAAGAMGSNGGLINMLGNIFMPNSSTGLTNGSASLSSGSSGTGLKLPSYAVGTDYVPHDMVAQIHRGEKIIPAGQNGAGGNTYYIDATGADAGAVTRLEQALMTLAGPGVVERRAQGTTFGDFRSRGAMRRAL